MGVPENVAASACSRISAITACADMVERWVASAWLLTETHFRKIDGHRDLCALATILGRKLQSQTSQEAVA